MRSELLIPLDPSGPLSLQAQIRQAIVRAIAAGELTRGARAPSSRKLARRLGVARNTVLLAYQQLVAEGVLAGRERSGLYVAPEMSPARLGVGEVAGAREEPPTQAWRPRFRRRAPAGPAHRPPPDWARYPYPFIDSHFDLSLFPASEWREASRRALSLKDVGDWASHQGEADDPMLIDEIRTKILPRRGIHARPDEILITLGVQQGLQLALGLFADGRVTVAMEEPGYADARQMALATGAKVVAQPVDEDGLVVDARLDGADVILTTPSHQFPTGAMLSLARRTALIELAARNDAVLIEDDFECDSAYFDTALPALRALPGGERVVYVAGLSKVLSPGLRMGFMVADAAVIAEARRLRRLAVKHPPLALQRAAAYFLALGFYDTTMARVGRAVRARKLALREALNHYLRQSIQIAPTAGGSTYWVRGPEGINAAVLAHAAEKRGVLIEPMEPHFAGPAPVNVFRLGVSGVPAGRVREGVRILAELIRETSYPRIDADSMAPALKSGETLRRAMAGATLLCKTVYGDPCTMEVRPDGRLVGRAGYANEDRDTGRWWIDGEHWFRQWDSWAYGEVAGYRPLIEHGRVQWLNAEGVAVDSAVYVPPGAPAPEVAEAENLAPHLPGNWL